MRESEVSQWLNRICKWNPGRNVDEIVREMLDEHGTSVIKPGTISIELKLKPINGTSRRVLLKLFTKNLISQNPHRDSKV